MYLKAAFVLAHKLLRPSETFRAMEGSLSSATELINSNLLHRLPQVAFTWRALLSWFDGFVITQHNTRTFFSKALATSETSSVKIEFKNKQSWFNKEKKIQKLYFYSICNTTVNLYAIKSEEWVLIKKKHRLCVKMGLQTKILGRQSKT